MRRFVVAVCMVFAMVLPAFSSSWTLVEQAVSFDPLLAESVHRWKSQHWMEIGTILTEKQRHISKEIVRGTLNWAYTQGNRFNADEFLASFQNRDDSVYVIRYPDGGLGFVVRGVYLRIQIDRNKPGFLTDNEWPEEGRWFAEIGCGSHSQTFYFLAARQQLSSRMSSHVISCPIDP